MIRRVLLVLLMVMSGFNFYLDTSSRHVKLENLHVFVVISLISVLPALLSYLVAQKTHFQVKGLNPYKLSADFILSISLGLYALVLFIFKRPEYYQGASHLYVVTWPIIIGIMAVVLYISCLLIQVIVRLWDKNITKQSR